jgi:hypothetical protein
VVLLGTWVVVVAGFAILDRFGVAFAVRARGDCARLTRAPVATLPAVGRVLRGIDTGAVAADLAVAAIAVAPTRSAGGAVDAGAVFANPALPASSPILQIRRRATRRWVAGIFGAGITVVAAVAAGLTVVDAPKCRFTAVGDVTIAVAEALGAGINHAFSVDTVSDGILQLADDATVATVGRVLGNVNAGIAARGHPFGADTAAGLGIEAPTIWT